MEELNNTPAKLDIGEQINDAFEIFKKIALMGGLAMTCVYLVILSLMFIGLGFFVDMKEFPELMKDLESGKLGLMAEIKIYAGGVLFISLLSPFMAGMLKMARDADNGEEVTFSSIYFYINSPRFIHIVLATATITILSNGLNLFLKHSITETSAALIGMLISLTISLFTYLSIPLIIFKNMNFINAIKTSIIQISNNLFVAVLLIIIAFLFSSIGILAFCIGILFTVTFMYAMNYSIFKKLNS